MTLNESQPQDQQFEQLRSMAESEFDVEGGFIEFNIPTFYVKLRADSKQAFLRLFKRLDPMGLIPTLRKREDKNALQIVSKPPVKPSRKRINLALFLATVATTFVTGYVLSIGWEGEGIPDPLVGAVMFAVAIMAIFGAHEMAHKLTARKHAIEASYPYFIPGPPAPFGIGTFGAVIQQKSLAPNKDTLFDLGISGPIIGFLVTVLVAVIGVQMSYHTVVPEIPPGTTQMSLLLEFLFVVLQRPPSNPSGHVILWMHPVAVAGWVGMLVTMLNLTPAGMLDGGHAARGLLGQTSRSVLAFAAILVLLLLGYWPMAIIAFFLSLQTHPGPLDDVSKLSLSRKLATIALVLIYVLCAAPIF